MRRMALVVAACAAGWLVPLTAWAQRSSDEDLIRGWYRDYLGRQVGPELQAWLQLLRGGMSPVDLQAAILGSDEYYAQAGRDPQAFVNETLQAVTWTQPTNAEIRRWTDRLTALRGDRLALAREILQTYGQDGIGAGIGASPAPAADPSEVTGRLMSAAKLLSDTLDFEIGGTLQGRQARQRAQALYDACDQLRRIVAIRTYRPDDAQYALQDAQRAFAALQTTLNNPPGTAPSSAGLVRRMSGLITETQLALTPAGTGPVSPTYPPASPFPGPGTNPAAVGYDQTQFLAAADSISRAVQSIVQSFGSQGYGSYSTSVVLRDLDTFAARVDDLKNSIRRGISAERLHWEIDALSEQAQRIGPPLLAGRPPQFTRLFWSSVEAGLAQMAEPLGHVVGDGGNTGVVGPGTVLRPTPISPSLIPLVDQALSRTDVFLTGTQPLVFGIPEVPRVQRDVRNIKTRLLTLRQETQDGQPASRLQATLQSMVADYQAAYANWGRIVTTYRLQNPPRLSPVGETLNQVEKILTDAVAAESLTPASGTVGQSRVARLLGTIGEELRQYREALPAFAAYNEHRALLTYLGQLDDYLAAISAAQRSPATAFDTSRRQAAGMQRVVALVAAQADSLAARVQAAGSRDLQNQARNLQNETNRLADLVDDLESQLQ
ncbi:MAG: hypothetical protein SFU86_24230 [Pirellulaceae bacterium]|nr:hypothetical protein [Pirellulaceae bacterium]